MILVEEFFDFEFRQMLFWVYYIANSLYTRTHTGFDGLPVSQRLNNDDVIRGDDLGIVQGFHHLGRMGVKQNLKRGLRWIHRYVSGISQNLHKHANPPFMHTVLRFLEA